ncbi:signal peptidase II [Nocardiopsis mangrovi]|uniref:Lipoprotein signal peptidase n=1 Tax=Nocardiopsis mangrovi TaxID=1179818 RepID=A0ABV9DSS2_9ACTN
MSEPATTKPWRFALLLLVAAVAIAADFATKEIALARLAPGMSVPVVGELLQFTLVFNTGAAFSIGSDVPWVFFLIASCVVVYILVIARRLRSLGWAVALGLILGGASGNLIDRVMRPPAPFHGAVVDWIHLPNWPVFNLADSCIVVGGVLAVILAFRGVNIDGTLESDAAEDEPEPGAGPGDAPEAQGTAAGDPGQAPEGPDRRPPGGAAESTGTAGKEERP